MTRLGRAGGWLVGIGIVALLAAGQDTRALLGVLAGAQPGLVVLGVVGLTAMHLVPAAVWRALVDRLSAVTIPWRRALRVSYAAQALGGLTPGNLGGDAYRVWAVRDAAGGWKPSPPCVGPVADRHGRGTGPFAGAARARARAWER